MSGREDDDHRVIPVHIVEYIDGRLDEHSSRVEKILRDHIKDETEQINLVFKGIKENSNASAERHRVLMDQLLVHAGWQKRVEEAFLHDERGAPDFNDHYLDHSMRRKAREWWGGVKDKTTTKIIEWTVIAFVSWAGFSLWQSFLKGPT